MESESNILYRYYVRPHAKMTCRLFAGTMPQMSAPKADVSGDIQNSLGMRLTWQRGMSHGMRQGVSLKKPFL